MANNRLTQSEYFKACSWLKENMHLPPMGRRQLAKELEAGVGFLPSPDAAYRIADEVGFPVKSTGKTTLRDKVDALERKLDEIKTEHDIFAATHTAALNALEERTSQFIADAPQPDLSPFQAG